MRCNGKRIERWMKDQVKEVKMQVFGGRRAKKQKQLEDWLQMNEQDGKLEEDEIEREPC